MHRAILKHASSIAYNMSQFPSNFLFSFVLDSRHEIGQHSILRNHLRLLVHDARGGAE